MFGRRAGAISCACLVLFLGWAVRESFFRGDLREWIILVCAAIAAASVGWLATALIRARADVGKLQNSAAGLQSLAVTLKQAVAELSASNARLCASEERFRGLVDAQDDAICHRGPDSALRYGNEAFFRLFGLRPAEALGTPFVPEPSTGTLCPGFAALAASVPGPERLRQDHNIRTAYGRRWIAWEDFAVRDAKGRLIEVQSIGRDITERKALEEALTEARDKSDAANRAKSRFLASMSHEIRTPMNGVLGMARLLLETRLMPDQKTYAAAIESSGEALLSLIDEVLDFSRIESGAIEFEQGELDIRASVEATVELLATRAHEKGIEIAAVISSDTPALVRADAARVRQILTNLVSNAVKFTEKGGVWVEVRPGEEREKQVLRFDVHDTGIGVPAAMRADIFREFVQADSTHGRRFGGSGLGLAIAKRLVEAMGGAIGVTPRGAEGSTFWFSIPAPVLREAPAEQATLLSGRTIAVVTHNNALGAALAAQIRAAGGEAALLALDCAAQPLSGNVDATLVDSDIAGSLTLENPVAVPGRSFVLLVPAKREEIPRLRDGGFKKYLFKPVRQASLAELLRDKDRNPAEKSCSRSVARARPARPSPQTSPRRLRILLAEDNPVNILLTRELLRRRGHQVIEVMSGQAAVDILTSEAFDMLITDLHMPGLDGIEATRLIRAAELKSGCRPMPIIALTADVLDAGKEACYEAGMNGFLAKPVAPAELDEMIARLFPDRSHAAAE